MKKIRAGETKLYRDFVNDRDRAAEHLLFNSQRRSTEMLRKIIHHVLDFVSRILIQTEMPLSTQDETIIHQLFQQVKPYLSEEYRAMRRKAYILSYGSQTEILSQVIRKPGTSQLSPYDLYALQNSESISGGQLEERIALYLYRLANRICEEVKLGKVLEEKPIDILERIVLALPQNIKMKIPPRGRLPRLKEADAPIKLDQSVTTIDEDFWNEITQDYLEEHIPDTRDPKTEILIGKELAKESGVNTVYAWEYEKDLTEEFVKSVREGENDAASEIGITEFIHVAVVDNKTDQCCLWRDGLTVSEIEEKLKNKDEDEQCLGTVPPLHFNCATAGHLITTNEGDKLIETIKPGMFVLTDRDRFKEVTRALQSISEEIIEIRIGENLLRVTPEHPLLVENKGWTEAQYLSESDKLICVLSAQKNDTSYKVYEDIQCHDCEQTKQVSMPISSIKRIKSKEIVYNFSVQGDETYILNGVISHNCRCRLEPALDNIKDVDQSNVKDFDEWLMS